MAKTIRLQVALAKLGFASRRAAAKLIQTARVKVNNQLVLQPGQRVDPDKDIITVDGRNACLQNKVYFLLNKPKGVVTTVKDRYAQVSVLDLIKQSNARIFPVGRLDKDTTGLLLLTNDGELAHRLSHPKFGMERVYQVCVKGKINQGILKELEAGIFLEGKKTFPCQIKLVSQTNNLARLEIRLTEGRKRQIKKMFASFGHPVINIKRIVFGPFKLGALKPGQYRRLKEAEIAKLRHSISEDISYGALSYVK